MTLNHPSANARVQSSPKSVTRLQSRSRRITPPAIPGALAQPSDPAILKQLGEKYDEDNSGGMGAGGLETWTFQAMAKGATTLIFEYARQFEKNVPPAKTSKFKIIIQ